MWCDVLREQNMNYFPKMYFKNWFVICVTIKKIKFAEYHHSDFSILSLIVSFRRVQVSAAAGLDCPYHTTVTSCWVWIFLEFGDVVLNLAALVEERVKEACQHHLPGFVRRRLWKLGTRIWPATPCSCSSYTSAAAKTLRVFTVCPVTVPDTQSVQQFIGYPSVTWIHSIFGLQMFALRRVLV